MTRFGSLNHSADVDLSIELSGRTRFSRSKALNSRSIDIQSVLNVKKPDLQKSRLRRCKKCVAFDWCVKKLPGSGFKVLFFYRLKMCKFMNKNQLTAKGF